MTELELGSARLRATVQELDSALVAFSGGVDSTYLLAVCLDLLRPEQVLAVTVDSPLLPRSELDAARSIAKALGARHQVVHRDDLADPLVASNPPDRCYHCKHGRFSALKEIPAGHGLALLHGENADDKDDYRPGARAAHELGVRAPLAEAGLTKSDIRALSRRRGLPTWNLPARACLATRFPYGTPLTAGGLARVEAAESFLTDALRLGQLRVRDHFPLARIEVEPSQIALLATPEARTRILERLGRLGYRQIALDLTGYRMGSLNDEIQSTKIPGRPT